MLISGEHLDELIAAHDLEDKLRKQEESYRNQWFNTNDENERRRIDAEFRKLPFASVREQISKAFQKCCPEGIVKK